MYAGQFEPLMAQLRKMNATLERIAAGDKGPAATQTNEIMNLVRLYGQATANLALTIDASEGEYRARHDRAEALQGQIRDLVTRLEVK